MIRCAVYACLVVFSASALGYSFTYTNPVLGETPAAATLEYFGAYDCVFCEQFERELLPALGVPIAERRLRVVFRDLPPDDAALSELAEAIFCQQELPDYLAARQTLKQAYLANPLQWHSALPDTARLDRRLRERYVACLSGAQPREVLRHNGLSFASYRFVGTPAFILVRQTAEGVQRVAWSGQTSLEELRELLVLDADLP